VPLEVMIGLSRQTDSFLRCSKVRRHVEVLTRDPRDWTTALARQPEPPALVLDQPNCYHFRVLDPRGFAILAATRAAITIGHCYHL
jgi:hypothetical protein